MHCIVRVHVRYDIQHRICKQTACNRIGRIEQRIQHAFDKPLRHRFPRMLTGNHPHFFRSSRIALHDQIHIAPLGRAADILHLLRIPANVTAHSGLS